MFGVLCVIGGGAFLAYLIYLAVNEDNKRCNNVEVVNTHTPSNEITLDNLIKQLDKKFESLKERGDELVFRGLKFRTFVYDSCDYSIKLISRKSRLVVHSYGIVETCNGDVLRVMENDYNQHSTLDAKCLHFLKDLLDECTVQFSATKRIEDLYILKGFFLTPQLFRHSNTSWISINDGEYYACTPFGIHKLEDWSYIDADEAWEIIKDAKLEKSDDPKKIHWEHFLKLEMLAKKQREKKMQEFVDGVLSKQVKYNDLQLQYEMLPTAPITDIETFLNFCKIVKEDVNYEPHEIQNYLFMKKLK